MLDLEQLKTILKLTPNIASHARISQVRLLTYVLHNKICDTIPKLVENHDRICQQIHADGIMTDDCADEALVMIYNHELVQKHHSDVVKPYIIDWENNEILSSRSSQDESPTYNSLSQPSMFYLQIASIAIGMLNTALLLYRLKV